MRVYLGRVCPRTVRASFFLFFASRQNPVTWKAVNSLGNGWISTVLGALTAALESVGSVRVGWGCKNVLLGSLGYVLVNIIFLRNEIEIEGHNKEGLLCLVLNTPTLSQIEIRGYLLLDSIKLALQ